jgi:hypothetical protein
MARIVTTTAVTLPSTGIGQPAVTIPKGAVLEVTTAQAAAITAAGGTTRAVSVISQRDLLGEAFAVSNSSA